MQGCIFCKIVSGEIASELIYEDDDLIAFHDISPQAPVHILIVARKHIESLAALTEEDEKYVRRMLFAAQEIARKQNIDKSGFRFVINCNKDGGQEIFHLHAHVLGGRPLAKMC